MIQAFLSAQGRYSEFPWIEVLHDLCSYEEFLNKFVKVDGLDVMLYKALTTSGSAPETNEALLSFLGTLLKDSGAVPKLVTRESVKPLVA